MEVRRAQREPELVGDAIERHEEGDRVGPAAHRDQQA
jgi:hypothetical protein